MSWDFSTDPEFEAKLTWMRTFMRTEVMPLEILTESLDKDAFLGHVATLQAQVKQAGLWATHLPPDLGGQGFGQVKLALMHEVEGEALVGALGLRQSGPGFRQRRDPGTCRQRGAEAALAPSPPRGKICSAFSMTEPENAGSDPSASRQRRLEGGEWVVNGHKWFSSNAKMPTS